MLCNLLASVAALVGQQKEAVLRVPGLVVAGGPGEL